MSSKQWVLLNLRLTVGFSSNSSLNVLEDNEGQAAVDDEGGVGSLVTAPSRR